MEHVHAILAKNIIGSVASLNVDGSPWATPLHLFADDTYVYWFSKDTQQHSRNVERDSRVSISLWSNKDGLEGAYIAGRAEKLIDRSAQQALDVVVATLGSVPPVFADTAAYRVPLGRLDAQKSSDKRWYFYS